jgi:putative chitinase
MFDELNKAGITDKTSQAVIMGRLSHESGGFKRTEEGLNYGSVEKIRNTFGKNQGIAKMSDAEVQELVGNKEKLANVVYSDANRSGSSKLGNTEPGDGWKYRGRGFIQITGKSNYAAAGKALGIDLVNDPDLAQEPNIAAQIAIWYIKTRKLEGAAKAGDVNAFTKGVNCGYNGLAESSALTSGYMAKLNSGGLTTTPSNVAEGVKASTANQVAINTSPTANNQTVPALTPTPSNNALNVTPTNTVATNQVASVLTPSPTTSAEIVKTSAVDQMTPSHSVNAQVVPVVPPIETQLATAVQAQRIDSSMSNATTATPNNRGSIQLASADAALSERSIMSDVSGSTPPPVSNNTVVGGSPTVTHQTIINNSSRTYKGVR